MTAADLLNDRVLPLFESHGLKLLRILTDRGTEYCGKLEYHEYQLYLNIERIEHIKTKVRSPQTNGIGERFHKTINEFYRITFRRKLCGSLAELQADADVWVAAFNEGRPNQGHWCFGKTPMQTGQDSVDIAKQKNAIGNNGQAA